MATIGEVFEMAASKVGRTWLTLVSNQGDAIASYIVGEVRYERAPEQLVPGEPTLFERNHLVSSADAIALFSDRLLALPTPGQQQPFDVEAPSSATIALAPSGNGDSHSQSWDVQLELPVPFNRTFEFTAAVMGSTVVGVTPAIGLSEQVDEATHVLSLKFVDTPR